VTFTDVELLHPFASVTVTVYVPLLFTVMLCDELLVDHKKPVPPAAVRTAESPWQNAGATGEIDGVGSGLTVTLTGAETPIHPLASVTVTVKLPLALTLIICVLAELLHAYVPVGVACKSTEPPAQNTVGPRGVMTGTGFGFTVTVTVVVAEHPSSEKPVTVYVVDELTLTVTHVLSGPDIAMIPACGCQWYDCAPDMQICTEPPLQIEGAGGDATSGSGFTVTVMDAVAEQSAALCPMIVYVVVTTGFAVTLLPVVALNPVAGDHV
jgi:hypothetical protein